MNNINHTTQNEPSPFTAPMPTANRAVPKDVPVPATNRVKTPYLIITVFVLALLVVGGIGWSTYSRNTVKRNEVNIFDKRNVDDTKQNIDTDETRRITESIRKEFGKQNGTSGR